MIVVNEHVLLLGLTSCTPLLCCSKLSNQVKSLLLAFKHFVLLSSSTKKSLQQNDSSSLSISLLDLSWCEFLVCWIGIQSVLWSSWSHLDVVHDVVVCIELLLVDSKFLICNVNIFLSIIKSFLVILVLTLEKPGEILLYCIDTDLSIEYLGFLHLQNLM